MYNILVTGSKGQLGSDIKSLSKKFKDYKYFYTDINDLDISDIESIQKFVRNHKINIIINCAAYTSVDKAETELELANKVNHLGVKNLALVAKKYFCKLVHISTDYVFDGKKTTAYAEHDIPNPLSVYGKTKLAGEESLKTINPKNCIIIRTSWVYNKNGKNFVNTMLKLGQERDEISVVDDQFGSPTYAIDLAEIILQILPLIKNKKITVFHYTNDGFCSWADFANEIFKISNTNCLVNRVSSLDYPTQAVRPSFSVLDKSKIKEFFDIEIPSWEQSLTKMLKS